MRKDDAFFCTCSSNGLGGGADWKLDVACTGASERAVKVEDPVTNGVAALSAVKDEKNGSGGAAGGAKKRRGPAVLMEGSRCSRVNGRGWRCSQPTLVGYSLCEHHLGKGRQQRSASGGAEPSSWRNGAATLGRTEPRILKKVAPLPEVDRHRTAVNSSSSL